MKKYFYVLRCVLAAKWVVERKSIPPMELKHLLPLISENKAAVDAIEKLLVIKAQGDEKTLIAPIPLLDDLIMKIFDHCDAATSEVEVRHSSIDSLNLFFRSTVKANQ
jgi:predicted nucleotidyltransferase